MPYIDSRLRESIDEAVCDVGLDIRLLEPGELNYVLTRIILNYVRERRDDVDGRVSYSTYNEVLGVLSAITQEVYRRLVAPYEDEKIEENGDVY